MDRHAAAYRGAGPADWAPDLAPTPGPAPRPVEEWEADGWDAGRIAPKSLELGRAQLAERVLDPAAPDGDDDLHAYDGLTGIPRRWSGMPRGAGIWVPWLADAARSTGLPVVEVPGWRTRGHGPMRVVELVVGHQTGTADTAPGDYPSRNVVTEGRTGLSGPLCNLGLGRSGTIYVVAAGVAYHAGASAYGGYVDLNDEALGIEAEDNGDGRWSAPMRAAYPRLVGALLRYMRRGADRYVSHRSAARPAGRKPDPAGWADDAMRAAVAAVLSPPPSPPVVAPSPPVVAPSATHTVVPGDTLFGISRRYGVSLADLRTWNGLSVDMLTVGLVLRVAPAAAGGNGAAAPGVRDLGEGDVGDDVRALQEKLAAWYPAAGIVVDGRFGPQTKAAVIRAQTGTPPHPALGGDGICGAQTRRKLGL